MANSIYPDIDSAGGVVYRNADGSCVTPIPADIINAYCPPPAFKSTCAITALPSNCDARVEPRQINAIVSELLAFAACINPTGTWNCDSLQNLCAAFTAWAQLNIAGVIVADTAPVGQRKNVMWWESDTANLYINYDDGNSIQWVQIAGTPVFDNISIVEVGVVGNPHMVGLVDCGEWV